MLSHKLATIDTKVPIEFDIAKTKFERFGNELKNYFLKYEMKSLANRLFVEKKSDEKKEVKKDNKNQLGLF